MSGGHSETINACSFCHASPLAVTASSDRTLKLWDASTGGQRGKMGCASGIYSLDIALSDSVVATGHRDGSLKFWSIRDCSLLHELRKLHEDVVASVAYHPYDGNQIITSSRDHTVKVVDVRMLKVVQTVESEHWYATTETSQIAVSPAGRYLALGSKNGKMVIVDIEADKKKGGGAATSEEVFSKPH